MRVAIAFTLMILCTNICAEDAYVLIDAINVSANEKQPNWIGLQKGHDGYKVFRRIIHVPTKQVIVKLNPGNYQLHHIDFHSSLTAHSAHSGQILEKTISYENGFRFKAVSGAITYVGLIEIAVPKVGFSVKRDSTEILLKPIMFEWACAKNAEIFEKLPVRFAENAYDGKPIKINCET